MHPKSAYNKNFMKTTDLYKGAVTFDEIEKARGEKKKSPTFRNLGNETVIG